MEKEDYLNLSLTVEVVIDILRQDEALEKEAVLEKVKTVCEKYQLPENVSRLVSLKVRKVIDFLNSSYELFLSFGESASEQQRRLGAYLEFDFLDPVNITFAEAIVVSLSKRDFENLYEDKKEGDRCGGFVNPLWPEIVFLREKDEGEDILRHEIQHIRNKHLMPEVVRKPKKLVEPALRPFKDELVAQMLDELVLDESTETWQKLFFLALIFFDKDSTYQFNLISEKALEEEIEAQIKTFVKELKFWKKPNAPLLDFRLTDSVWMRIKLLVKKIWKTPEDLEVELLDLNNGFSVSDSITPEYLQIAGKAVLNAVRIQSQIGGDVTTLLAVTPIEDWEILINE